MNIVKKVIIMQLKDVRVGKHSNSFCFIVPKAYIKDGNIELSRRYNVTIEPAVNNAEVLAIEQKTQEIVQELTKNANKIDTA